MVCRVFLTTPPKEIQALFETVNPAPNVAPNYNGAPRQRLPVVRLDRNTVARSLDLLQWGVPFPSPGDASTTLRVNVTCETVATRSAYGDAFERRRCLVPVDGFYAWQKRPEGRKQPYAITSADRAPLALAGFWDEWRSSAEAVQTFTIITVPPNELMASIHHRMPAILPREGWLEWLGEREASNDKLLAMLRFYPAELMEAYPVNERVGNVQINDASLIQPLVR
jgi:putative SOS response-associated peptidase YedK